MGGNKNGDFVLPRKLEQMAPKHIARGRVDTRSGLVENQHLGLVQAGGGQLQALAHAQRKIGGAGVGHFGQIKLHQRIGHGLFARRSRHLVKLRVQEQILAHAQFFIQRKRLRHIAHTHAHCHAARVDGFAEQFGLALRSRQKAGEHFHGGGFAAAVGAEKAENFAFFDAEAHIVYRSEVAETLGEPVRFHRRRRSGVGHKRGDGQSARALLLFRRQHFDIGLFQRVHTVLAHHFLSGRVDQQFAVVHCQQMRKTLGLFNISRSHDHRHAQAFFLQLVHQSPELAAR